MSDSDNNMNYWANQWRNMGGVNVIPVDSKTKIPKVEYKHLKDKPIADELHNYWIKKNMFKDGIDIINGSVWHNKYKKHLYLHTIDLDNELAIKEVTNIKGVQYTLEDLSKRGVIVEQHPDDKTRAHILVYSEEPFPNLSAIATADNSLPRIEVKGIGKLTTVTHSMHTNGSNYEFIGDSLKSLESPVIHTEFMYHVNDILKKYGIEYLNGKGNKNTARIPIKNDEKVYEGARHDFLINRANLIYGKNMNILPSDILEQTMLNYNIKRCSPPLPEQEVKQICKDVYEHQLSKLESGNGKGDGNGEYAEALDNANRSIVKFAEDELAEIPNRDYSGFIINAIKREVKRDDVLIRQVFYTGFSAYTFEPINLGIISPTSEGKTYTTMKVVQYFPKEDVWLIGQMSDKALIRQKGILINSKGESIQKQIDKLREELHNTTTGPVRIEPYKPEENDDDDDEPKKRPTIAERVNMKKAEIKKELDNLLKDAIRLIDLQGKILVFLEPPRRELWNLVKPILSHDNVEISFDYVDKTEKEGFRTQRVIVRGWPACIFCSAKDESRWEIWPEIQSRFLITSPNINQDKVHDGNVLIAQRKGLPNAIQQKIIVSDKERELAKKAVSYLKRWIHNLFESNGMDYQHRNAVWIPYGEILANALKSERGTDNRVTDRIFSLLTIIPLTKVHHRPNLVYGKERLVIAELEHLSETLHITQNVSGIPTHKLKFYKEIFLPLYESKTKPDIKDDKIEDRIAVTTAELREYNKSQTGKSISTANIKNTFLNELLNNGFIDEQDSVIDKRQKIYFPIMETSKDEKIEKLFNEDSLNNFLQPNKIIPSKYFKKIPENWLELEISTLKNYLVDNGTFKLIDGHDNYISIPEFIKNYTKQLNLNKYFVEPGFSNNYSEIMEGMKLLYGNELG